MHAPGGTLHPHTCLQLRPRCCPDLFACAELRLASAAQPCGARSTSSGQSMSHAPEGRLFKVR